MTNRRRSRKRKAVAHIVTPRSQLAAAERGDEVHALCGAQIFGRAKANAAVCQACMLAQLETDDAKAEERNRAAAEAARQAGDRAGRTIGRADAMREIQEAAERRAAQVKASQ